MVLNLTGAVAVNVSLMHPLDSTPSALSALLNSQLLGVMVGSLVTYLTTNLLEERKSKSSEKAKRKEIYSRLRGIRSMAAEIYASLLREHVYLREFQALCRIAEVSAEGESECCPRTSKGREGTARKKILQDKYHRNLQEIERAWNAWLKSKSDQAKINQDLYEILGQIRALFPNEVILETKISEIEQIEDEFEEIIEQMENARMELDKMNDFDAVKKYGDKKIKENDNFVKNTVKKPIDDLSGYLFKLVDNKVEEAPGYKDPIYDVIQR